MLSDKQKLDILCGLSVLKGGRLGALLERIDYLLAEQAKEDFLASQQRQENIKLVALSNKKI